MAFSILSSLPPFLQRRISLLLFIEVIFIIRLTKKYVIIMGSFYILTDYSASTFATFASNSSRHSLTKPSPSNSLRSYFSELLSILVILFIPRAKLQRKILIDKYFREFFLGNIRRNNYLCKKLRFTKIHY